MSPGTTPSEWKEHIHPNGWIYFVSQSYHVVTTSREAENSPIDPPLGNHEEAVVDVQGKAELYINHALQYASSERKDIVDNIVGNDNAAAEARAKFWIAYWNFMYRFPAHHESMRPITKPPTIAPLLAAQQVLNFFKMDLLRRRSDSEAPFTLNQCKELIDHLNKPLLETAQPFPIPDQRVALHALVAWVLWTAAKHYKLHRYGQHLRSDLEAEKEKTPLVFHALSSGLLFGAPRSHLERIRTALKTMMLQDRTDAWVTLLKVLEGELNVSNLGATVLLASSSAFLAVPGLDRFTRIVTLTSVVLTLSSVMTGLYLQWQTGKIRFKNVTFRPTALALLFSLPFAALVWGIILFTLSVIMYSVLGTADSNSANQPAGTASTTFGMSTWIPILAISCVFTIIVGITVLVFRFIRYKHRHRVSDVV
ncbi:hypothetical protein D9758_009565 [Tetrapyrgos nigripes]|uniref:Uncharacterized protein n=1 Tax=Tetrapyrgos nigripes TaxID=182062 RepID=A0A8H5GCU2_9AGAR|nr:hypothetical protein D9758_009565 [Tetrapyrgos nigripes]